MDTIKECRIPECSKVPDLTNYQVAVGFKQLRKALRDQKAQYVFLAKDADPAMTMPIAELCMKNSVEVCWCQSMTELGKSCSIDVGASAAAVLEPIRF